MGLGPQIKYFATKVDKMEIDLLAKATKPRYTLCLVLYF